MIKRIVRKAWTFLYLAIFCPLRFRKSTEINQNSYFTLYFSLYLLSCLALVITVFLSERILYLIPFSVVLLFIFLFGTFCQSIALTLPLLMGWIYWRNPYSFDDSYQSVLSFIQEDRWQFITFTAFFLIIPIAFILLLKFSDVGNSSESFEGVSIFTIGVTGFCFFIFTISSLSTTSNISYSINGIVFIGNTISTFIRGFLVLPLSSYILVSGVIAFMLAPIQNHLVGIISATVLVVGKFGEISEALLISSVVLTAYYRILPDYPILFSLSLIASILPSQNPLKLLHLLPPYITEILWLPLPKHSQTIAAAFRVDASEALVIFQMMQTFPLPGFRYTIQKALPQVVSDQLITVGTIDELIDKATSENSLLSTLVPAFYPSSFEELSPVIENKPKEKKTRSYETVIANSSEVLEVNVNWIIDDKFGLPVTIVTGPLGSGKSTLINQIVESRQDLVFAIIQSEYGDIAINESAGGFIEHAANNDTLIEVIYRILEREDRVDHLIVETSGSDDPLPIALNFLGTELRDLTQLTSILTVIDPGDFPLDILNSQAVHNQLLYGDIILITKVNSADANDLDILESRILDVKEGARTIRCLNSQVALPLISELGIVQSIKGQTPLEIRDGLHLLEVNDYLTDGNYLSLLWFESDRPFIIKNFQNFLDNQLPENVFRAEGILWFVESPKRHVFFLSGKRFGLNDTEWQQIKKNQLLLIGQNLDTQKLSEQLSDCLNHP